MKIEFVNVCCGYEKKDVLQDLSFEFETGKFYCLLGANGIGKTTLFKTLLGFIDVKRGKILINGKDISAMSNREIASYISYVPQAKNYSYQYTVQDIVLMGRALHIRNFSAPSEADVAVAMDAMGQLDILDLKDKMYAELSGGEQQVVLIARALAQKAQFIVMDEPASNLDFENQKKVLDVLKTLAESDIGVVMSSHSPDHAFYCNASVLLIRKDKTIAEGMCDEVITSENLYQVYGVRIKVLKDIDAEGNTVRCCYLASS